MWICSENDNFPQFRNRKKYPAIQRLKSFLPVLVTSEDYSLPSRQINLFRLSVFKDIDLFCWQYLIKKALNASNIKHCSFSTCHLTLCFVLTSKVDQVFFCSLPVLKGNSQVLPRQFHDNINFSTKSSRDLMWTGTRASGPSFAGFRFFWLWLVQCFLLGCSPLRK